MTATVKEFPGINWRLSYRGPGVPWPEIRTGPDKWLWPDCSFVCVHCGECLGCLRNLVFDFLEEVPTEYVLCGLSPSGLHGLSWTDAMATLRGTDTTNAAQRLQTNCVDAWDWSYVEGSSLADGDIQQDIAAILEENRRLREELRRLKNRYEHVCDAAEQGATVEFGDDGGVTYRRRWRERDSLSRQTDDAMDELDKAARETWPGETT